MRLTILFLIIGLQIHATGLSQDKVTLNLKNASVESILKVISKQTGYQYALQDRWKDVAKKVDIAVTDASVAEVLSILFKDQPFTYQIVNKIIVVRKKDAVMETNDVENSPFDKVPEITGLVQSENGDPLIGATIKIRGGKVVAVTDKEGKFVIHNFNSNAVLEISYTGFSSQDVRITERQTHLNIVLKISNSKLDDVQVIAYGTTTPRFNVGSVSTVTAADIASQPIGNPLEALEGRVPGLVITSTGGIPGSAFTVQIRGQNTVNTNFTQPTPLDNPLFIVDGVPFAAQNGNLNILPSMVTAGIYGNNPYGGISPLNSINPSDIESIEVLRDADATAIYGSRGANGVILITTKKGKAGKTKFNANVWSGGSQVTRSMPMMNTRQYLDMRYEAIRNDGDSLSDPNLYAPDLLVFDTTRYTDWKKAFLGATSHATDAYASLSGGNTNNQFLIGSGYHLETYITPGGFSEKRASFSSDFRHSSTDKRLNVDFNVTYTYTQNNSSGSVGVLQSFTLVPDFPTLFNPDGTVRWTYNGVDLHNIGFGNPLAYTKATYLSGVYNLISHFQIGFEIAPGLNLRSSFGYNSTNSQENSQTPTASIDPSIGVSNSSAFGTNDFRTWIIEPQVDFHRTISHGKLKILIGSTIQQNTNAQTNIQSSDFTNDALLSSISAAAFTTVTNGYSEYKYSAVFGRINYLWNNKYIINVTGRRDGSSRFGPGKQFGDFGSVGGGWIFSEESFVKSTVPFISFGKLRATYGTSGNDNIGDYQFQANWIPTTVSYQGTRGYVPINLYQPNFAWQVNKKLELGLDFGFFKDRILTNLTWFQNRCSNQLVSYQLPIQTGFNSVIENFPATVQNTGWEIQLTSANIRSDKFSWNTSINLSIPRNELKAFPGLETSPYASTYIVGKSLSILQKFKYIGVNDTTGVFEFATAKGSPTYTPNPYPASQGGDYQVLSNNLDPKFYGGLRNTFIYRGIQLDIFVEFRKQLGTNYLYQLYSSALPGQAYNMPTALLSRWQKPGDQSVIEQFSQNEGSMAYNAIQSFINSSGVYTDASFIRFKTLALSYSIGGSLLKKAKIEGCRIYVNGQNLLTITNYKGNDPETQNFYGLPPLKTIVAGINFTF